MLLPQINHPLLKCGTEWIIKAAYWIVGLGVATLPILDINGRLIDLSQSNYPDYSGTEIDYIDKGWRSLYPWMVTGALVWGAQTILARGSNAIDESIRGGFLKFLGSREQIAAALEAAHNAHSSVSAAGASLVEEALTNSGVVPAAIDNV